MKFIVFAVCTRKKLQKIRCAKKKASDKCAEMKKVDARTTRNQECRVVK
jgi:hypothetical protein